MQTTQKTNVLLYLLVACFWSGSFIGIKAMVDFWPPMLSAAMRVTTALLALRILMLIMRKRARISNEMRWKTWVVGIFSQGIPFAFLFWGEQIISPGLAGILNATVPVWTFIFAAIFLPESTKASSLKLFGLVLAITGIILIFWPILSFEKTITTFLGAAAVLVMAMSYATGGLLNQYLVKGSRVGFMQNVYHQHWGSVVFLWLCSLCSESFPSMTVMTSTSIPWLACAYLGIFSTAIAYIIYYHLIREWDALRASTVLYVIPILTLIWDDLFFNQTPTISELIGVMVIIVGVVLLQVPLSMMRKFIRRPKHA